MWIVNEQLAEVWQKAENRQTTKEDGGTLCSLLEHNLKIVEMAIKNLRYIEEREDWVVNHKLAEVWEKMKEGGSDEEGMHKLRSVLQALLRANFNRVWKIKELENKSMLAHMTDDVDWQHEICAEIDKVWNGEETQ